MISRQPEATVDQLLEQIQGALDQLGHGEDLLPGELRWTDEWLTSDLQMLSLEARGLFSEMLTQAWREKARLRRTEGDALMRLVRATPEEWERTWPIVTRYWKEATDPATGQPVLVNKNQLRFYLRSLAMRMPTLVRNRKAAANSVEARRERKQAVPERPKTGAVEVPPCPECQGPLERKQRSSSPGGQRFPPGWWCRRQRINLVLNDPRIYNNLTPAARASVDNDLSAHERNLSETLPPPPPPKGSAKVAADVAARDVGIDALTRARL